jgi:hypothetical protein
MRDRAKRQYLREQADVTAITKKPIVAPWHRPRDRMRLSLGYNT